MLLSPSYNIIKYIYSIISHVQNVTSVVSNEVGTLNARIPSTKLSHHCKHEIYFKINV